MNRLGEVLASRFPGKGSGPLDTGDYAIRDDSDGRGPKIVGWNAHALGPEPDAKTLAQWTAEHVAAPATFHARDLIDLLSDADLEAIEAAIAQSTTLRRLWLRLQNRDGRPIPVTNGDFTTGWAAMAQAIGGERAEELATALGFPK